MGIVRDSSEVVFARCVKADTLKYKASRWAPRIDQTSRHLSKHKDTNTKQTPQPAQTDSLNLLHHADLYSRHPRRQHDCCGYPRRRWQMLHRVLRSLSKGIYLLCKIS